MKFILIIALSGTLQFFHKSAAQPLGPLGITRPHRPSNTSVSTADGLYSPGLLTYHGGDILTDIAVTSIFWGTTWGSTDVKIQGMDSFFGGIENSAYANTITDSNGDRVTSDMQLDYLSRVIRLLSHFRRYTTQWL